MSGQTRRRGARRRRRLEAEATAVLERRVVYGARCSWWDTIDKVATLPSLDGHGLPCCPYCRGALFEVDSEAEWWAGVDEHERRGAIGYTDFVRWLRGRCFPSIDAARAAYEASTS